MGEIKGIKALTGVSDKTTIGHPVNGEINKARAQEITAHTTTDEASDRTNNTKIITDPRIKQAVVVTEMEIIQIQLGISGHQTDPKITIGAGKTEM